MTNGFYFFNPSMTLLISSRIVCAARLAVFAKSALYRRKEFRVMN